MKAVELLAYNMILRNGTVPQIRDTLRGISKLETAVPENLLVDIIATLRDRGKDASKELSWVIYELLGKTQSVELYRVADELGYLELSIAPSKMFMSSKVHLFVVNLFYHPDVEQLVIDELYQLINYLEQTIHQYYMDDIPHVFPEAPQYDKRLEKTSCYKSPLCPIGEILPALNKIGSPKGREAIRAIDQVFRSRLNDYLSLEKKRADSGDSRALKNIDNLDPYYTVYSFRDILDRLIVIAAGDAQKSTPAEADALANP